MKWGKLAPALRVATQIGPYFVVVLDCGPATAFGLRLASTPRTKACPRGPQFWPDLRPQRRLARKLIQAQDSAIRFEMRLNSG